MFKFFKKINNKGFTLIELMVATSVFTVVMLIAMGSLIITSDAAKKAQTLNFTMDNLNFAMESMTRSLRMGTDYYCSSTIEVNNLINNGTNIHADCLNGASAIAFVPAKGNPETDFIIYLLEPRNDVAGTNTIQRFNTENNEFIDIISSNIDIQELKFFSEGSSTSASDKLQPKVYMKVR